MKQDGLNTIENHARLVRTSDFRFYEELNDFLPQKWKKTTFPFSFFGTPSIKNTIETIGVPHAEIDLILVNGESVDFSFLLRGGERISVYPIFELLDISPVIRLRSKPLRKTQFIVDVNLGKLAKKLRLLGFDTLFRNDLDDPEIVEIAAREKRIILTRDKGVLKYNGVTHGYWLRSNCPQIQLKEVVEYFQLKNSFNPFSRCSDCNGILCSVKKENIFTRIAPDTFQYYSVFWECSNCRKIYWKGSHFIQINQWLEKLNENAEN